MSIRPRLGRPREIVPGLWRLSVAGYTGLTVHVYVLREQGCTLLIDAGWTHSTEALEERLAEIDVRLADIDGVLLTHSHEDHMGGVVAWHDRLRAPAWCWEGTEPAFGNYYTYHDENARWDAWWDEVLPEGPIREQVLANRRSDPPIRQGGDGTLPTATPVAFGASLTIGPWRFRLLDGRGHDRFHGAWLEERRGWFFSGDVLLRVPTPVMPARGDSMAQYRGTLLRWRDLSPPAHIFPGHGQPETELGTMVSRSLAFLEAHHALLQAQGKGALIDPAALAVEQASSEPRAFRRRFFVWLTNLHASLIELERDGIVKRRTDRRWEVLRPIPDFGTLVR